jgi:hypothetical protein
MYHTRRDVVSPKRVGGLMVRPAGDIVPWNIFYFYGLQNAISCLLDTFYDHLKSHRFAILYVIDKNVKRLPPSVLKELQN